MAEEKILIADDDESIRVGIAALLEEEGYSVIEAADGEEAWRKLQNEHFAVLLADLKMPGLDGLQLLKKVKKEDLDTQVVIITGQGTISTAVRAMKSGAYDYLTKPVNPERIKSLLPRILEHYRLRVSHEQLQEQIRQLTHYEDMVGQSAAMQEIYRMIDAVADSTANVVLTGESGTGKELVARAIHRKSGRRDKPFIAVNVSALPEQILENELFGHERGAFTGAISEKPGCFEMAHGGTLFLDEIGEMAYDTQAKLLRVLEERRFRRLGGKKELEVDVRIIAATNRNLQQAVQDGHLREDLYFRLCVVEINLPPLRDRIDDIPLLADEFLQLFSRQNKKQISGMAAGFRDALLRYSWPGNVRELKNVIERAVLFTAGNKLNESVLPPHIKAGSADVSRKASMQQISPQEDVLIIPIGATYEEIERQVILETLKKTGNNKTKAAKMLGVSLKTIHNKLNKFK
ncbi:MAG: sigma-54-dependent Fis family transcriptional regulator [Calditrichaeota bacterium]|nr:sigma-54-dependent Fis family transcriptional regulator [Calditrichota bacterium]